MDSTSSVPSFPLSKEEYQSLLPLQIPDDLLESWVLKHCTVIGSKRFTKQRYETLLANHFNDAEVEKEGDKNASDTSQTLVASGVTLTDDVPGYLLESVSGKFPNDANAMNVTRFCYTVSTKHLFVAFTRCIYSTHLLDAFTRRIYLMHLLNAFA